MPTFSKEALEHYWNNIPDRPEEAYSYSILCAIWGCSERDVRRILHALSCFDSGDDFVLIRSSRGNGFYKTNNPYILNEYREECLKKGRSIFAPVKKINRILRENDSQFSMSNNLRVKRCELNLRQQEVCDYMQKYDCNFNVPMLSKMENGVCLPTPFQLSKLAKLYECAPEELVKIDLYA